VVYWLWPGATVVQVLKQAGDNLTRENIMKQAAALKDLTLDTLLPGVKINTQRPPISIRSAASDGEFKGEKWDLFGPIITERSAGNTFRLQPSATLLTKVQAPATLSPGAFS